MAQQETPRVLTDEEEEIIMAHATANFGRSYAESTVRFRLEQQQREAKAALKDNPTQAPSTKAE